MATRVVVLAASLFVGLAAPGGAAAALTIGRAELKGSQLRVEGQGAAANARISVDGTQRGTADGAGLFRIDFSPFTSSSCRVTVSDGVTTATAPLTGCSAAALGKPTFALHTLNGAPGQTLAYQAAGSGSSSVAFRYDWGDGSSTRDPATGFYAVDPATGNVLGNQVGHAWSAAGSFSVTVTALDSAGLSVTSDPITVTIAAPAQQNDCGSGLDAGNSLAAALATTLPVACSGSLSWSNGDMTDVYSFAVAEPFRLLTLTVAPPGLFGCCPPEIALVDPSGALRSGLSLKTLCADPQVLCNTAATPPVERALGYTLDMSGTWKLILGGDFDTVGHSTFVEGTYSFTVGAGGGGDDCVQGRAAVTAPAPLDAPNNDFGIRLLDAGEANCSGSLPFAARDFVDSYVFPVLEGEPVAVSVASADGFAPCSGRLWATVTVPGVRASVFPFGCIGDALFNPGATGTAALDLQAAWSTRTELLGHQIRVATGAHHSGDCFTGGDAGDSFVAATALPVTVCVGDIGAADPDDWYSFSLAAGDEISFAAVPCGCALNAGAPVQPILPMELYDPDGLLKQTQPQSTPTSADKPGVWRVRVTGYTGTYGFRLSVKKVALTGLTLNPTSVSGTSTSEGAVFFDSAPAAADVTLSSSNPSVASVPASVTVRGSTVGGFPVTTSTVAATTTVTISASFAGVTKTATLTVTPSAPADSVAVTRADYSAGSQQLRVEATSTGAATLRVFVGTSTTLIGTLTDNGGGGYDGQFTWPNNPGTITVRSSLGGSATASVTAK
jgi:hypothetical protein